MVSELCERQVSFVEFVEQLAIRADQVLPLVHNRCTTSSASCGSAEFPYDLGDPSMTRTCDLRFRKPSLYPPELWDRMEREG